MWCAKTALAVATVLAVAAVQAGAEEGGWTKVQERNGIQVSSRPRAGSGISEMRAVGIVEAPSDRVLAVLVDMERYPQFMPPTTVAQLLRREGNISLYYMEINPPVIARRDYCLRVGWEELPGGRLRSFWETDNVNCLPERRGIVRVHSNDGEWILEPIDGGRRTYVQYRCHIEVGGHVPAWMVNRVSASEIPNVFAAVQHAVRQPRYAACCQKSTVNE